MIMPPLFVPSPRQLRRAVLAGLSLSIGSTVTRAAATAKSDITPQARRQISVELAEHLARQKRLEPLPAEMPSPFNPADFDKAEAPPPGSTAGPSRPATAPAPGARPADAAPAAPTGDREILEMLAGQITPSGMIVRGGQPLVIVKGKPLGLGTVFTVTYKDHDYDLELVAIQGNNFTLRYRNEETTRPIKPVR